MSNRIQGLAGPYRRNPGLLTPELEAVKALCDKCGASNKIDWLADMKFPRQPIVANDGGVWIPITFPVDCSCGNTIDFEIPKKPVNGGRIFYGDEAHRVVQTKWGEVSFFCITLMGLHPDRREEFNRNLLRLKAKLKPEEDPESWTYHATSIWSTHSDKQVYNLKSVAEKVSHARAFAKLIRETRPHITSINVSSAIRLSKDKEIRSVELKTQKEDILKQATLTSLKVIRKNSMSISWVYDNVKDSTNGEKTEGWADECFLGLQHSRQFIYLTAQANIQKPTFVRPGSHYLLEAADFMSFWVAREFFRLINKQTPEIKCALMGKGLYQVTDSKGDAEFMTCNGSEAIRKYFKPQR